ncbi:hypothetical protein [Streptomyces sp. NPDC048496]|uniref:hypothetical protein n=1 Tax=Streptomyces sp. NPDC048496 TaxID=3365558 RepID=UPI0037247C5F
MEPLFQALCDHDCLGDLAVWGPVAGGPGGSDRWVAVTVNQCDGDAPMIIVALVGDRPVIEPRDGP